MVARGVHLIEVKIEFVCGLPHKLCGYLTGVVTYRGSKLRIFVGIGTEWNGTYRLALRLLQIFCPPRGFYRMN